MMINDFFANIQAHADSINIIFLCSLDFTEEFEKFIHFIFLYSSALVNDIDL